MKIILRRGGTLENVDSIRDIDGEKRAIFKGHAQMPRIIEMSNIFEIYSDSNPDGD